MPDIILIFEFWQCTFIYSSENFSTYTNYLSHKLTCSKIISLQNFDAHTQNRKQIMDLNNRSRRRTASDLRNWTIILIIDGKNVPLERLNNWLRIPNIFLTWFAFYWKNAIKNKLEVKTFVKHWYTESDIGTNSLKRCLNGRILYPEKRLHASFALFLAIVNKIL